MVLMELKILFHTNISDADRFKSEKFSVHTEKVAISCSAIMRSTVFQPPETNSTDIFERNCTE